MMKGLIGQKSDGFNGDLKFCFESRRKTYKAGIIIITCRYSNLNNKHNNAIHGESLLKELELMALDGMTQIDVLRSF